MIIDNFAVEILHFTWKGRIHGMVDDGTMVTLCRGHRDRAFELSHLLPIR